MQKPTYQERPLFPKIIWNRPLHQYKHEAGKIFVVAGSKGSSGRALLVCEAVFRSGTGILLLGHPEVLKNDFKNILPVSMSLELPETLSGSISSKSLSTIIEHSDSCDVSIIGPGLSTNPETIQLIWEAVKSIKGPLVVSGEGLTAFIKGLEVIKSQKSIDLLSDYLPNMSETTLITTPSDVNKMLKIVGIKENVNSRFKDLGMLSERLSSNIILAESPLIYASYTGAIYINKTSQKDKTLSQSEIDVLSGIVGSFVGQNITNSEKAIVTAIYIFDYTKAITAEDTELITGLGGSGSAIIRNLTKAIKKAEDI